MDEKPHIDFRNHYILNDGDIFHIMWSARGYKEEDVRVGVAQKVTALEGILRYLAHHGPLANSYAAVLYKRKISFLNLPAPSL